MQMAALYDGRNLTKDEAAKLLIYDDNWAIHMCAAYLYYWQTKYGLTNRQIFIAYAFHESDLPELWRLNFNGNKSHPRGQDYDKLFVEISKWPGYKDSA
jgi:hypothetical protein